MEYRDGGRIKSQEEEVKITSLSVVSRGRESSPSVWEGACVCLSVSVSLCVHVPVSVCMCVSVSVFLSVCVSV